MVRGALTWTCALAFVSLGSIAIVKQQKEWHSELQAQLLEAQLEIRALKQSARRPAANVRSQAANRQQQQQQPVQQPKKKKVAIITLALGDTFGKAALEWLGSSSRYFCHSDPSIDVYHLVLTNQRTLPMLTAANSTRVSNLFVWPHVKKRGWPADTLAKFADLVAASDANWVAAATGKLQALPFSGFDFLLMTDADQRFVRPVCEDLLGQRVALAHPQYWDRSFLTKVRHMNGVSKCQTFYPLDNDETDGSTYFVSCSVHCICMLGKHALISSVCLPTCFMFDAPGGLAAAQHAPILLSPHIRRLLKGVPLADPHARA